MKFEDLKLGGWYTHPAWIRHKRVYCLKAQERSSKASVTFDCGEGTSIDLSDLWFCTDGRFADLTEYDEYADAKALVEMRIHAHSAVGIRTFSWDAFPVSERNAYKSLAAKLREQGWKGAGK